ncbi:hypothetical protein M422DRAFT_49701, partial [Sphaerobolus stellatus SS14]
MSSNSVTRRTILLAIEMGVKDDPGPLSTHNHSDSASNAIESRFVAQDVPAALSISATQPVPDIVNTYLSSPFNKFGGIPHPTSQFAYLFETQNVSSGISSFIQDIHPNVMDRASTQFWSFAATPEISGCSFGAHHIPASFTNTIDTYTGGGHSSATSIADAETNLPISTAPSSIIHSVPHLDTCSFFSSSDFYASPHAAEQAHYSQRMQPGPLGAPSRSLQAIPFDMAPMNVHPNNDMNAF